MEENKFYATIRKFPFLNNYFAFMDTEDYLANGIFIRHKVRVYFGPEYIAPDSPYRAILCHVRKRDTERFLAALKELPNKMLLCGYADYLVYCEVTWNKLKKVRDERRDSCEAISAAVQAQ